MALQKSSALEVPTVTAFRKEDFRKWLKSNHKKESRVAVILHKRHTGKNAPTHRELILEAICFGWIDTTLKRIDDDTYLRHFAKRNKNSKWSDNTLRYAKELLKEGRMAAQGIEFYNLGRARPTHDHDIPKNPDMPDELRLALSKNKKAKAKFDTFPPSTKKMMYRWLLSAKRQETKDKRVKVIVRSALIGNKNILGPTEQANA